MRRRIVAGNWKLHGSSVFTRGLLNELLAQPLPDGVELIVMPPFPFLAEAAETLSGSSIRVGAQDVSAQQSGAYTGEVAASMLRDVGCTCVLVGHSERRQHHGEDELLLLRKVQAAAAAGLRPVICLGESLQQREAGHTDDVLRRQLAPFLAEEGALLKDAVLAYEPVWAIGTGLTASPEQAQAAHLLLRSEVAEVSATIASSLPILYGGSVKPANAAELFSRPDVDGGLIGGASMKAPDFLAIAAAAAR